MLTLVTKLVTAENVLGVFITFLNMEVINMSYDKLSYYDKYIYDQYMLLLDLRDVVENCEEYVEYHPSLKLQLELKELWVKMFSDDIDRIFSNR